jgi:hypothetical protein
MRKLKVTKAGDIWKHKDNPILKIRLEGKWLAGAGFAPGQYVRIDQINPGQLMVSVYDDLLLDIVEAIPESQESRVRIFESG